VAAADASFPSYEPAHTLCPNLTDLKVGSILLESPTSSCTRRKVDSLTLS
jgi:hypothetical protein